MFLVKKIYISTKTLNIVKFKDLIFNKVGKMKAFEQFAKMGYLV